jgi:hypothetical protein
MLMTARMSVAPKVARARADARGRRYNASSGIPGEETAWAVKATAIRVLEPTSAALATGADVLIAAAMLTLLQRNKTGLRRYVRLGQRVF